MIRRTTFWASMLLAAGLLITLLLVWLNFRSSSEFNGRYQSSGRVVLSDGKSLEIEQTLLIKDGRFYAMTQIARTLLNTSGEVESGFLGRLRLRVEKGEVLHLSDAAHLDNDLLFNMLYTGEPGSIITLRPIENCYLAVESRQLYCKGPYSAEF